MDGRISSTRFRKILENGRGQSTGKAQFGNIVRVSDFRLFLADNYDDIVAAAGGYRISWDRFLKDPDIIARGFKDHKGNNISPRLAAQIWRRVRLRRAKN
jgi:hypothetical protein